VGNFDPRGVQAQPDYDGEAARLRRRVEGRLPDPLPSSSRAACSAMLDAAARFYAAVAPDDAARQESQAQLQATRAGSQRSCEAETSIAAAACATLLLDEQAGELPWVLDQCSRAFPAPRPRGAAAPAGGGGAAERDAVLPTPAGESAPGGESPASTRRFAFVGDVIFGRYRGDTFDPIPEGDADPFADVRGLLVADEVIANLETPLVRVLPASSPIGAKYRFGADPGYAKWLASAGFTAVSLANNHAYDQREAGLLESAPILRELGVEPFGASVPAADGPAIRVETLESGGWKVAVLAVTNRRNAPQRAAAPVLPFLDLRDMPSTLGPLIEDARRDHDLVMVWVHWGAEYADAPAPVTRQVSRALIDLGVDAIIGHHPHVLQGVERHGRGVIAYSLGNFLFEDTRAVQRLTGVLHLEARRGRDGRACWGEVRFKPAWIDRRPFPHPVAAVEAWGERARGRMLELSAKLGTTWTVDGEDLRVEPWGCDAAPSPLP
jgi:poly-gamma-glutamate synthesis protein (capsule biosynthesis protein)